MKQILIVGFFFLSTYTFQAQPMVAVIPTLFAGMLLGGIPVMDSLIVVLLLTAASFVANVLSGVVALQIIKAYGNKCRKRHWTLPPKPKTVAL